MTLPEVLRRVVLILEKESVAYMVTGSFATAYYAHPRATQDIDLVVEPSEAALERVARDRQTRVGQARGSEIQLRDVQNIVRTQWDQLDRPYLKQWIAELGLGDVWDRVIEAIDLDPGGPSPS